MRHREAVDQRVKLVIADRLLDEPDEGSSCNLEIEVMRAVARHEDDRSSRVCRVEAIREGEPVLTWKLVVAEEKIDSAEGAQGRQVARVGKFADLVAILPQHPCDRDAKETLILDDQDRHIRAGSAHAWVARL